MQYAALLRSLHLPLGAPPPAVVPVHAILVGCLVECAGLHAAAAVRPSLRHSGAQKERLRDPLSVRRRISRVWLALTFAR